MLGGSCAVLVLLLKSICRGHFLGLYAIPHSLPNTAVVSPPTLLTQSSNSCFLYTHKSYLCDFGGSSFSPLLRSFCSDLCICCPALLSLAWFFLVSDVLWVSSCIYLCASACVSSNFSKILTWGITQVRIFAALPKQTKSHPTMLTADSCGRD